MWTIDLTEAGAKDAAYAPAHAIISICATSLLKSPYITNGAGSLTLLVTRDV